MNLVKKLLRESLMMEVGEGSAQPYPWRADGEPLNMTPYGADAEVLEFDYVFSTESGLDYQLIITYVEDKKLMEISFTTDGGYKEMTNRGEFYRIMATVVDIAKDFAAKNEVGRIYLEPSKTASDDDKRRHHIYARYIQKLIPDAKVDVWHDYVDAKISEDMEVDGSGNLRDISQEEAKKLLKRFNFKAYKQMMDLTDRGIEVGTAILAKQGNFSFDEYALQPQEYFLTIKKNFEYIEALAPELGIADDNNRHSATERGLAQATLGAFFKGNGSGELMPNPIQPLPIINP